ncbi:sensor histidine kinase [Thiomicrorhabdus sp. Kp2]|uniref:sensor histidine kinase n=1 Tax=Thiomicrorhabdus sp. Kp2 TaxID=1123518 RepID=UPI000417795C|nr:sensor histidine kinase [Thiomicrorhabdus sp. Kp2]
MKEMRFWLLALLLMFTTNANAVILSSDEAPHFISIESYLAPSKELSLADVIEINDWQSQPNHFSFGYSGDTHWIKIELQNISDKTLSPFLWITETFLHKVVFYEKVNNQWQSFTRGLNIDINHKDALDTYPHFQVHLKPQEAKVIYVQFNGQLGVFGALLVSSEKDFYDQVLKKSMIFSSLIVALIMLSIFYLVLHVYIKEASFIYYSLYSLSYSIWVALYNGLIPMFFNEWVNNALYIFMPIAFIFLIKFSQSILDTRTHNLRCHIFLNVLIALYVVAIAFIPFDVQTGFVLHNVAVTITMVLLIILSLKSLARKERLINLYVVGLFAYFSGMIVLSMLALGWLPYNVLTRNAPFPGSIIEFAFFAYILALKVFQIQDEKEISNQCLVEMQAQTNLRLERQVSERTSQLEKMLKKQNGLVKQYASFISFITHELRNPLGIIKSQIALLRKESEKGINNCSNRLNTMSMTTQRMEMLFDDWLLSDKLENDLFSFEIQTFELSDWMGTLEEMIKQTYSTHQFYFEKQSVMIHADSVLLKLAFYNLIDNAVKYSPVGSLINIKIVVTENNIFIYVEDHGAGVSEEDAQKIFERFVRGKGESHIQGTGIGLSLVKNVMELHGGAAYIDREYKKGSRFVLRFKRA